MPKNREMMVCRFQNGRDEAEYFHSLDQSPLYPAFQDQAIYAFSLRSNRLEFIQGSVRKVVYFTTLFEKRMRLGLSLNLRNMDDFILQVTTDSRYSLAQLRYNRAFEQSHNQGRDRQWKKPIIRIQ